MSHLRNAQQLRGLAAAGAVMVLGFALCSAVIAGMTAGAAQRRVVLASLDDGEEKVRRAVGSASAQSALCAATVRGATCASLWRVCSRALFPFPAVLTCLRAGLPGAGAAH